MLKKLIDEKLISARAVFGFWPTNQVQDDDLEVYGDDGQPIARLHHLRQQIIKTDGKPNFSLADFVAPKDSGVFLSEHYAMFPAAAVSGWYFAHPQAQYFAVGKVDKDQVTSYTARKGQDLSVTERWLAPNLGYDN